MRPDKRVLAIVVGIVASVLVVVPPAASSPVLAQTPSLTATKTAPGNLLAGKNVPYTISTTNSGTAPLYNVTFRDVLPLGTTYVGPSTPADFGEPEIIVNQVPDPLAVPPATIAQQTLIWSNIGDLQPGSTLALSFSVALNRTADPARPSLPVYQVGSTVRNSAESYASPNERVLPAFDAQGVPIDNPAVTTTSTSATTTRLTAIEIRKSEPSPEGELLRGVHRHTTVYTLDVETTGLAGVAAGAVVTDYLPAQLEFLGCGGVDNSTVAGGQRPEYPGAPLLTATPTPAGCRFPDTVETVTDPPPSGSTVYPPGVYTKLTWILTGADTASGTTIRLPYAAGIPLRANVPFPAGTPTTGVQASNLDNNTGASTRELPTEQAITNIARVSGTYLGTPAPGGSTAVADDDRLTRTIEDVRIRKSIRQPVPNVFRTGALAIYDITVDVSEYVNASGVVLTDSVPNGMCPRSNVAYVSTGPDNCGIALGPGNPDLPSIPMASVTPNPGGGFSVVFTPIPAASSEANDTFVVSYTALMRQAYEGGPLNGRPTVSGDTFTNNVVSTASTTPIPNTPETGTVSGIQDGSSATLVSGGESISKGLLPRDARRVPPGTPCPATGYIDPTTVPPAQYFDKLAFRLGDEICFLLRVDFDPSVRTRNPVVTDFLPAGVEYVAGSMAPTANNVRVNLNLPPAGPAAGPLVLNLGDDDPLIAGTDRFVDLGAVMEVVFKGVVVDVPDSNAPLITGNLMKMRTENSAGQARSYRDRVGFGIVPAPPILLTKGVAAVDVPAFSTTLPDQDDKLVQQGSVVTYRIDLTNDGSRRVSTTSRRAGSTSGTCCPTASPAPTSCPAASRPSARPTWPRRSPRAPIRVRPATRPSPATRYAAPSDGIWRQSPATWTGGRCSPVRPTRGS